MQMLEQDIDGDYHRNGRQHALRNHPEGNIIIPQGAFETATNRLQDGKEHCHGNSQSDLPRHALIDHKNAQ